MPTEPSASPVSPHATAVTAAIEANKHRPGALMPILHAIQDALGHVPEEAVPEIAGALNLTRAEVHGVISFYHDFRSAPPGRHLMRICRAESCQAVGAEALISHARSRLGVDFHGTTADGAITLEPVYCLGNCALSPALMVGKEVFGRMTPARFDALVDDLRRAP
ncbi:MAG TPA: formate dehydrogenase subunit gamma [Gemmatimonadales bacterium]|nr:formate dehydrogenase subunit gamma [Gemmatimonadales bacterium]